MLLKAPPLPQAASADKDMTGGDDILFKLTGKPYQIQTEETERLGLGSREYEIVEF